MNRMEIIGMVIFWNQICRIFITTAVDIHPCFRSHIRLHFSGFKNPDVLLRAGYK